MNSLHTYEPECKDLLGEFETALEEKVTRHTGGI